jgi:hypothetical protein
LSSEWRPHRALPRSLVEVKDAHDDVVVHGCADVGGHHLYLEAAVEPIGVGLSQASLWKIWLLWDRRPADSDGSLAPAAPQPAIPNAQALAMVSCVRRMMISLQCGLNGLLSDDAQAQDPRHIGA